jgi:hypothetical protein
MDLVDFDAIVEEFGQFAARRRDRVKRGMHEALL